MKSDLQRLHVPVMLNEALEHLQIKPDGIYVDCTLGEGGHSYEIYKQLSPSGVLISFDQDQNAINYAKEYYKEVFSKIESKSSNYPEWILVNSNFSRSPLELKARNLTADGVLMDLGLSSRQLEQARGFSFMEETAPLDMRMDESLSVKASDLLKVLTEHELTKLLRTYGEERHARQIARAVKNTNIDIVTVGDLNNIVRRAVPAKVRQQGKHPAMRVFQALRIAVNDELNSLRTILTDITAVLNPTARLVAITFHSLEDRITKQAFIELEKQQKLSILTKKPIIPSDKEIQENPRARSAKMRVAQK